MSKPIPDKVLNFGQVSDDQVEKIDPKNIPEKLTERLPKPTGWRIVILPYKGTGKTKGALGRNKGQWPARHNLGSGLV